MKSASFQRSKRHSKQEEINIRLPAMKRTIICLSACLCSFSSSTVHCDRWTSSCCVVKLFFHFPQANNTHCHIHENLLLLLLLRLLSSFVHLRYFSLSLSLSFFLLFHSFIHSFIHQHHLFLLSEKNPSTTPTKTQILLIPVQMIRSV